MLENICALLSSSKLNNLATLHTLVANILAHLSQHVLCLNLSNFRSYCRNGCCVWGGLASECRLHGFRCGGRARPLVVDAGRLRLPGAGAPRLPTFASPRSFPTRFLRHERSQRFVRVYHVELTQFDAYTEIPQIINRDVLENLFKKADH